MTFVKKHGLTDTIEHRAWARIRRRCYSPSYHNYPRYGGRGIEVCERWDIFENFLADMGPRPGPEYSIERIDNDGDYEPCNCKWATREEQARNKMNTYTEEEDQILRDAVARGLNFKQMAGLIEGRTEKGIMARVYRLGLRSGQPCSNYRGGSREVASPQSVLSSQNGGKSLSEEGQLLSKKHERIADESRTALALSSHQQGTGNG